MEDLQDSVRRLLNLLRVHVGMEVAWLSEFTRDAQVLRYVDVEEGRPGPSPGTRLPLNGSYCVNVLAGRMPSLIPDTRADPLGALLPVSRELHIESYLGVPLTDAADTVVGMLCATSSRSTPGLSERDLVSARLMAGMLQDLFGRSSDERAVEESRRQLRHVVQSLCEGDGRRAVLQPIVDVSTGLAVAAEGLTRFAEDSRSPAQWFDAAHSVGLGAQFESAAAAALLEILGRDDGPPVISVNLSPATVMSEHLDALLQGIDLSRVVVELTEHAPVRDYVPLLAALAPYRDRGLRVAIDDAGAGYASLAHVLRLTPEFLKIDMSLVRNVHDDPARQALVTAMVAFGHDIGCAVIAEGVETEAELSALRGLGVELVQGYLYGHPSDEPWRWDAPVPRAAFVG